MKAINTLRGLNEELLNAMLQIITIIFKRKDNHE
jgi:hypothetical protein